MKTILRSCRSKRIHCSAAGGVLAVLLMLCSFAAAEDKKPLDKPADGKEQPKLNYEEHVKPIFKQYCFSCHSPDTAKSDLVVENYAALIRGGASGEVIEPGDPEASRLWKLVSHEEAPEMPPKQDKLPEAALATIKQWIAAGALENAGSKAKVKDKPKVELKVAAGAHKPDGPPPMPEGLSRQPVVYTPRGAAVTALAASPWAPLVAVAGQKQILLYHTETAQLLGVLPFPEGIPFVLKFSRSGALLLAGGGHAAQSGKVVVFDVHTGKRVVEVGDELDAVLAADINDDHTRIALGGPRRTVKIFDVADGSLLHEIKKHTDWIYSLEFSPDGVLLATADRGGGLFVWEADTAREYQNLKGHSAGVTAVSWRDDGNLLASASEDGTIRLWEMENGSQVKSWNAHGGGVAAVAFAHDGRLVSAGRDRAAKIWDAAGAQQRVFDAFPDLALQAVMTHNGARVVAGDWTGEVRLCEAADGKLIALLPTNPPTLEMIAQAEAAKAAAALAAAEQAAAQLAAAQKALQDNSAAAAAAADKLKSAQAEAEKLAAEKAALEKSLAEKSAAAKAAADSAAATKANAEKAEAERAAHEKSKTAPAAAKS